MSKKIRVLLIITALVISLFLFLNTPKIPSSISTQHHKTYDNNYVAYFSDSSQYWNIYMDSYYKEFGLQPIESLPNVFRIFVRHDHISRNRIFEIKLHDLDSQIILSYKRKTNHGINANDTYIYIDNKKLFIADGPINGVACHDTFYNKTLSDSIKEKLKLCDVQSMLSTDTRAILGGRYIVVDVNYKNVNRFYFLNLPGIDDKYKQMLTILNQLQKYEPVDSNEIEIFQ